MNCLKIYAFLLFIAIFVLFQRSKIYAGSVILESHNEEEHDDTILKRNSHRRPGEIAERMCRIYSRYACAKRNRSKIARPIKPYFQNSIIGGDYSKPKQFSHMALIGFGLQPPKVDWDCGGSLISHHFVLGAAHCTDEDASHSQPTWIRLGELDTSTNEDDAQPRDFRIVEIIVHPRYNTKHIYNDVALFRFRGLYKFTDYIRPICLNTLEDFGTRDVIAAGWGITAFGEKVSSPKLQHIHLEVQDPKICDKIYRGYVDVPQGINSEIMLCAGYLPGGKDTCEGDSGGPLLIDHGECLYTQVGIVSYGAYVCGSPFTPSVFVRVSYFTPWIESIVWPRIFR